MMLEVMLELVVDEKTGDEVNGMEVYVRRTGIEQLGWQKCG